MKQYKNIIFDVGDVLVEYRWKQMMQDYGISEEEALRIGHEIFEDPLEVWQKFDLGLQTEEVIDYFEKNYPQDAELIAWFIRHGEYMHVPRPQIWQLVHELKEAGYHLYLLSNYPEELFHKHTEYADFMKDMDGMMVSYMIKKAKPDRAIYEALLEKYDLNPRECLFFDDRAVNIDGAWKAEIDGIQVTSKEQLAEELQKLLKQKCEG